MRRSIIRRRLEILRLHLPGGSQRNLRMTAAVPTPWREKVRLGASGEPYSTTNNPKLLHRLDLFRDAAVNNVLGRASRSPDFIGLAELFAGLFTWRIW